MNPHYYIMKNKKILRLEEDMNFDLLPEFVKATSLSSDEQSSLNQNEANWRVAIFRDEILDLNEYFEWLKSPESQEQLDDELCLIAN